MATREDIKMVIRLLKSSFPNYNPILDELPGNTVDAMLLQLGDLDFTALMAATLSACTPGNGRKFAPSADEIRTAAAELMARSSGIPTAEEAWGAVMKSMRLTVFEQSKFIESQHPAVKETIRCMGGLSIIGMSENNIADRAHFLKIYDRVRAKVLHEVTELPQITAYVQTGKLLVDNSIGGLANKLTKRGNMQFTNFLPVRSNDTTDDDTAQIVAEERRAAFEM